MDFDTAAKKCLRVFAEARARMRPKSKTSRRGVYSPQVSPGDKTGISNPRSSLLSSKGNKPSHGRVHLKPKNTVMPPVSPPPPPR
jgi:hypothetical protein